MNAYLNALIQYRENGFTDRVTDDGEFSCEMTEDEAARIDREIESVKSYLSGGKK